MVKITNGNLTLTVTQGAYDSYFRRQGFAILSHAGASFEPGVVTTQPTPQKAEEDKISQEDGDDSTPIEDYEPDVEKKQPELSEIPLSEMGFSQLQEYAEQLGLDYGGIRSKKELRALIRSHLKG